MSDLSQPRLSFHKNTFFELETGRQTLFIDPVFSRERRGRRVADELRDCDYLLATSLTPWFEDVLDALDEGTATFIGSPRITRFVSQELGLRGSRLLDLEPWERASEKGLRITAFPIWASIGMERSIREGSAILRDVTNVFPQGPRDLPLMRNARSMIDFGVRGVTQLLGTISTLGNQSRALGNVGEAFNFDMGQLTGGRPGLGYVIELEGFQTLMHFADGIHAGTSDDDLEDIADACEPDVLTLHVGGRDVEPYVRAARILRPKTILLYRSKDPYAAGRRGQTVPMSHFIGAIEEGAPESEVLQLRRGESYLLQSVEAREKKLAPQQSE